MSPNVSNFLRHLSLIPNVLPDRHYYQYIQQGPSLGFHLAMDAAQTSVDSCRRPRDISVFQVAAKLRRDLRLPRVLLIRLGCNGGGLTFLKFTFRASASLFLLSDQNKKTLYTYLSDIIQVASFSYFLIKNSRHFSRKNEDYNLNLSTRSDQTYKVGLFDDAIKHNFFLIRPGSIFFFVFVINLLDRTKLTGILMPPPQKRHFSLSHEIRINYLSCDQIKKIFDVQTHQGIMEDCFSSTVWFIFFSFILTG